MKIYLLFDSGCNYCNNLAREIQLVSAGKLEARSLRDPEIKGLLDSVRPGWTWQPMLVVIAPDKVQVFTGAEMATRITWALGPKRAWQIARLVLQAEQPKSSINVQRRWLLNNTTRTMAGVLLSGFLFRRGMAQSYRIALLETTPPTFPVGELFAGLLLLPEGAPVPSGVKDYQFGIPVMCGVHDDGKPTEDTPSSGAVTIEMESADDLVSQTKLPAYVLDSDNGLEELIRAGKVHLVKHHTGELWRSWIAYQSFSPELGNWYTSISILAQYDHPQPVPLWYSNPVEPDVPGVVLEKVEFLPGKQGVMMRSFAGFALHWIEEDVYFTLSVQHLPDVEPEQVVPSLRLLTN